MKNGDIPDFFEINDELTQVNVQYVISLVNIGPTLASSCKTV